MWDWNRDESGRGNTGERDWDEGGSGNTGEGGIGMKVETRIQVLAGPVQERENVKECIGDKSGLRKPTGYTIFAGNLGGDFSLQERVEQRKDRAKRRAMKVVGDAWDGDRKMDDEIKRAQEHIEELKKDRLEVGANHIMINKQIAKENEIIRGIREAKRKVHPMVDAQENADEIMDAARDEVIGMVMQDAKTHLDEEQEQREEQGEKIEEEKEKQEEILEERKEKEEELEDLMKDMSTDEAVNAEQTVSEVKRQVQNIINEMNLMVEDVKGVQVDANV